MAKMCKCCGGLLEQGATKCLFCGMPVPTETKSSSSRPTTNNGATNNPRAGRNDTPANKENNRQSAPSTQTKANNINIFSDPNWHALWEANRTSGRKYGIMLTNTTIASSSDALMNSLKSYAAFKAQQGIDYYVLDLYDQCVAPNTSFTVESIVALLRQIYSVVCPYYLMIVGDATVIPNISWYNVCNDGDEDVPSDLAYLTLDTRSPWDGYVYNLRGCTQVGRIPSKASNGFAEAIKYFENTMRYTPYSSVNAFGYSALVWEKTSRAEMAHLNPTFINSPIYTSNPALTASQGLKLLGRLNSNFNLLCFNLHGADFSHDWYGQKGNSYPEAFNGNLLPQNDNGYMIMVEACYGARHTAVDSIVVRAITNKCVAFVGSSKIAYGMADGGICCADVIATNFTKCVQRGMTAGNAFNEALSALTDTNMCEEDIKTLAEFALYGDPSAVLISTGGQKDIGPQTVKFSTVTEDNSRKISLMSCNENGRSNSTTVTLMSCTSEEQAKIKLMANTVSKNGSQYILEKFSSMSEVAPSVYKVVGKDEYRAVYSKTIDNIKTVIKMHMDGDGNIQKVYQSK